MWHTSRAKTRISSDARATYADCLGRISLEVTHGGYG